MLGKFLNGYDPTLNNASLGWTEWDVAGNGYPEFNYDRNEDGKTVHYGQMDAAYLTDVISALGQKFVNAPSKQPFLIELASFAPHAPYIPAPRDAALFPGPHLPAHARFRHAADSDGPGVAPSRVAVDPGEPQQLRQDLPHARFLRPSLRRLSPPATPKAAPLWGRLA